MKRLAALITGAAIVLGATLSLPGLASASVPREGVITYHFASYHSTAGRGDSVTLYRDGTRVGSVGFTGAFAANHLGQHKKNIVIVNKPGVSIHIRVDSGARVVDYHARTAGTPFTHTFWYPARKFRVTLDGWASRWFAAPIG